MSLQSQKYITFCWSAKNINRKLAGFHYTETIWFDLSDGWFGGWSRWTLLGMIFVLKHSLLFTLIRPKAVCQKRCHWKRICLRLIHMGSPYFTVRNTISHHRVDNHIGKKSSVRAYKLWHRHVTHVKWLNDNAHKENQEKMLSGVLLLGFKDTHSVRAPQKTGRQWGWCDTDIFTQLDSAAPPRRLSPPLCHKASYISANDLGSFPDLASAIQRIMNNASNLKLQK